MIKLSKNKKITTDIPFITERFTILHYDQEPILFSGFNRYGNRILASSVDSDKKKKVEIYFYVLIDEKTYTSFFHREITYKKILSDSDFIFLIKSSFDNTSTEVYIISFNEIPQTYVPLDDSYCPLIEVSASLDYEMKLQGLDANRHLGKPSDINTLTESFKDIVLEGAATIPNKDFFPSVFVRPYAESSFKILFNVELLPTPRERQPQLFNYDASTAYKEFIKSYIEYSLNYLDKEIDDLVNKNVYSDKFREVIEKGKNMFLKSGYAEPGQEYEKRVIKDLEKSATRLKEISETIGTSYNTVQFTNVSENGFENILGIIDDKFKVKIESALETVESNSTRYSKDSSLKSYEILVYHLNTASRLGNAIIYTPGSDIVSKPKFKVKGSALLEGSIFTESLHFNKIIKVNAIATKESETNKIKSLEIDFE